MRLSEPKGNLHNPTICGLDTYGRQLCPACERAAHAEPWRDAAALPRRRRMEAFRRALPPAVRGWLRALIRREVRRGIEDAA